MRALARLPSNVSLQLTRDWCEELMVAARLAPLVSQQDIPRQ
jgi:hypothetical protein